MKTQPLRKETNCLNCGTEVPGRYCTNCGQENTVPHETFGHLVKHFIADVVHYDSKTLLTVKYLLFRPGFLTQEYIAGKRASYVNPIKLYIFTSFVFFLLYFALTADHTNKMNVLDDNSDDEPQHTEATVVLPDSLRANTLTTAQWWERLTFFHNREQYDSMQKTLPKEYRDGRMQRQAVRFYFNSLDKDEHKQEARIERLHHNIPKMMFVLLPLFALFLRWMYDKKKWYYADHAIFSVHLHTFFFILYLFCTALDVLFHVGWFTAIGNVWLLVYLVMALKRIYGQSTRKSVVKGLLLVLLHLIALGITYLGVYVLISI